MKRLSKKSLIAIISLSVFVALVGLIVLLSFTAFSLKSVEINYRTSIENITENKSEIIKSGHFKMKTSVFFHGKDDYKKNIENFDPYIKVINIETVFPSKFVVHIAERQEIYAIKFDGGYYICDDDLRILRIAQTNDDNLPIKLTLEKPLEKEYQDGQYIIQSHKPNIYQYLYENNRFLGEQKSLIESITLKQEFDENINQNQNVTLVKFGDGHVFKIINDDYGMKYKVKLMLDVYSQMYDFIGKEINVEGQKKILTKEDIDSCSFVISNYYDEGAHSQKDCWFDIVLP